MTEKGKTGVVSEVTLDAPRKFQCGDLVARKEPMEGSDEDGFHLYKVVEVPLDHVDVSSTDRIRCQWFEPICDGNSNNLQAAERFRTTNEIWDDDTYTANTMMWVDPSMVQVLSGNVRNKSK